MDTDESCRVMQRFERFYDPASKRHYYFDKRTRAAQWTKPYCLKSTELRPPLTPDQGARRIQSFLRCVLILYTSASCEL